MVNHETYEAISKAARAGKPTAYRTLKAIDEARGLLLKTARRHNVAANKAAIEEHLAEAAIEANPWLKIELQ